MTPAGNRLEGRSREGSRSRRDPLARPGWRWAAWLLLAASVAGCSGEATAPATRREVTLHGFLYVGEAGAARPPIRLGRVGPIGEFYDPDEHAIDDALLLLQREGASVPETLRRSGRGSYVLPAGLAIAPRTTYHLTAVIPNGPTVSASTTTPAEFVALGGPPELPDSVRHEIIPTNHPIDVECGDPEQIVLCDAYCLEDWRGARYVNRFGGHDRPSDSREYGGDQGEPRHIFAYFRIRDVVRNAGGRYRIDFYNAMLAFYGRYDLNVMAIDKNTYNWLYRDHPEENGGVTGGIGVFGSVCRRRWTLKVVE